jgi:hypothetical protein
MQAYDLYTLLGIFMPGLFGNARLIPQVLRCTSLQAAKATAAAVSEF